MPNKLYDLARMTTATTGTGTITLGSAVSGYLSFAGAGATNGEVLSYAIKDGSSSEIGSGTYTSAGTTLTRTVTKSTNSNTAISLSGTAEVFITPRAEDLTVTTAAAQADQEAGTSAVVAVTPSTQKYHPSAIKAWVRFDASSGTPTIVSSYNVSSLTDNGVGDTTINFTNAFSSNLYSWMATCDFSSAANTTGRWVQLVSPSSGSLRILTCSVSGSTGEDMEFVNVWVIGDM